MSYGLHCRGCLQPLLFSVGSATWAVWGTVLLMGPFCSAVGGSCRMVCAWLCVLVHVCLAVWAYPALLFGLQVPMFARSTTCFNLNQACPVCGLGCFA